MALDLDAIKFLVDTSELDSAITKIDKLGTAVTALNKPLQTLEKETQKATKAQAEQTKAQEENTKAAKTSLSVLERQQQILEFMTQGFSKGQASVLTYAKAAGALTDELKILGEVQQTQRKLQGSEPFDRSIGAVKVLKNELGALREAQRQYNAGVELTTKQAKDLYREKFRLIEAMKIERQAARDSGDATVSESQRYAKLKQDLRDINKEYVALSVQRNKLANDDSLVQTQRRVNNLSRGLAPQISDVAVSLYGGMSPMTVLMQQGLQVRDLIQQSGVEAKDLDATLKKTGADFLSTISGTFKAIGSLAMGVFSSMGEGIASSLSDVSGISLASKKMKELGFISEETTAKLAKFSSVLLGAALPFFAVALGLTLKALYDVTKEQDALNNSLVTSGASLGLTAASARTYAESMNVLGVSTSKGLAVISEMAKVGGFTKESIDTIAVAATQMAKYTDLSIEDVVKSFDKLNDKPAKALSDFAIKTGLIPLAVLETVRSLEDQGKSAEATSVAIKAMGDAYQTQAAMAKAGMSTANLAWIELKSTLSGFYGELKKLAASDEMNSLITKLTNLYRLVVAFNVNTFRGIGDVANILTASGSPEAIGNAIDAMKKNNADSRKTYSDILSLNKDINGQGAINVEQQKSSLKWLERRTEESVKGIEVAKAEKWVAEQTEKIQTNKEKRDAFAIKMRKEGLLIGMKEKEINDEIAKFNAKNKDPKAENKVVDVSSVWEKITDAVNRAAIAYDEVVNGSTKYTNSQKVMMDLMNDKKFLLFSEEDKKKALTSLANAHAKEVETEANRNLLKVQLELQKVWDATVKARAAQDKIDFDLLDTTMALVQSGQAENEMLILQATLIGATDEVRKKSIKLKEIDIKYEKELAKIRAGTASDDAKKIAASDLAKWREQEEKNVNLIIANDAAEKLLAEYNRIRDGITDSIVTALFEGGKAGSKKLRDLIVAELKKPITMVVNALVNTLMNSVTGGVAGSAVSGLAGSAAGGMLGGFGTSILEGYAVANGAAGAGVYASAGGLGSQIGAAIAAVPVWGWIVGGLALIATLLDDSGTMHTGGAASYSKAKGTTRATAAELAAGDALGLGLADIDYSEGATSFAAQFVKAIGEMLDDTAKVFGKTAGYEISTAFADDTSKDGSWGSLVIKKNGQTLVDWQKDQASKWAPKEFADGEAGRKEYLIAVAKDVRTTLKDETPAWADTMLDALGDAPSIEQLAGTVLEINATQLALEAMGSASAEFASLTDEATAALIAAAGGAKELVSALQSYYVNFYSEEERKLLETKRLQGEFAKLNKEMPKTRNEFRAMMDAAIASGDTNLVSELLKIAPAFAGITEASADATAAAKEYADALQSSYDASKTATDEALKVTKDAINREKAIAAESLTAAEAARSSLQSIFDILSTNIRELYLEVTSTSGMLVSDARRVINEAIVSGNLPSDKILSQSISTVRGSFGNENFSTKVQADKARLQFAADLSLLAGTTSVQLTAAEQQVQLLKNQILQFDDMIESLDNQLKVLRGIDTSSISIDDSLRALLAIANEEKAAKDKLNLANTSSVTASQGGSGGVQNDVASKNDVATTDLGIFAQQDIRSYIANTDFSAENVNASVIQMAKDAKAFGYTQADIAAVLGWSEKDVQTFMKNAADIPAFATGGYHSGGMRIVGEDSPELEVTGPARYYNKDQFFDVLKSGFSGGDNSDQTELLRAEVRATAQNTAKLARLVERLIVPTTNGDALQTTAV